MQIDVQSLTKAYWTSSELYSDKKVLLGHKAVFLISTPSSTGFEHIFYTEYSDPTAPKKRTEQYQWHWWE